MVRRNEVVKEDRQKEGSESGGIFCDGLALVVKPYGADLVRHQGGGIDKVR